MHRDPPSKCEGVTRYPIPTNNDITPRVGDHAGQMANEGEAKQEGCGVEIDKMDNHVGLRHEFSSKVPRMVRVKLISVDIQGP
jgi:hypothetical protein